MRMPNLFELRLAALAVILAAGPTLWSSVGQRLQTNTIRRALTALPDGRVGAIRFDRHAHRMIMSGVHFAISGMRVDVDRVSIPDTSPSETRLIQRALAASDDVTLDNLQIGLGTSIVKIPRLDVKGSSLSTEDWRQILDPNAPDTIEDRVAKLSIREVRAANITVSDRKSSSAEAPSFTLHEVMMKDLKAGRIETLMIQEMGDDGKAIKGTRFVTGALKASQIDFPLAMRTVNQEKPDPTIGLQPVLRNFELTGMTFAAPDMNVALGSLRSGVIQVRPFRFPLRELFQLSDKPEAERSDAEKVRMLEMMDEMVQSMRQSVRLDHVEMGAVAVRDSTKDPLSMDIDQVAIDGAEPEKVEHFRVEKMSVVARDTSLSMGRLSLDGYDQRHLMEALQQDQAARRSELHPERYLSALPLFDGFSVNAIRIDTASQDLSGNAAHGTRVVLDVPSIELKRSMQAGTATSTAHAQIVMNLDADIGNRGLQNLQKIGLSRVDISLDSAFAWSAAKETATLDRLALSGVGLGSVSIAAGFSHVSPHLLEFGDATEGASQAVQSVEVDSARVDVTNSGIAERGWTIGAKAAGVSVPLLKAEAKGQVQLAVLKAMGDTPAASKVTQAVSTFIDDPKTLTIAAMAPAGLTIKAIMDSGGGRALVDLLDIEARADQ